MEVDHEHSHSNLIKPINEVIQNLPPLSVQFDNHSYLMEVDHDHSHSNLIKPINEVVANETGQASIAGIISESQSMDDEFEEDDDVSEYYGSDGYSFDDLVADDYANLQAQYDNVDLPPGVEASVSWLKPSSFGATFPPVLASSSLSMASGSSSKVNEEETVDELMVKYAFSKRFDTVQDISDHHFSGNTLNGHQPSPAWIKKIREEWEILANNLPETIFVRVYESRMDLLTAVIVGPQGTPYHDGLFVFDAYFPLQYPDVPPLVHYYSGGLRLNPNLYNCGKVCLSLLNTWTGHGNEKWLPRKSTMLQVLLSIQALILNAKPFFNEPGYEKSFIGEGGRKRSDTYNEEVLIMSLKTMIYTLNRPPKYFEDIVVGHFRLHAHDILSACKAYINGAKIGSLVNGKLPEDTTVEDNSSQKFKSDVKGMVDTLISIFSKHGAKGCEQFKIS